MTQHRTLALTCCLAAFAGCDSKTLSTWMAESSWSRPMASESEEVRAKPIDAAPLTLTPQTMTYSITPLNKPGSPSLPAPVASATHAPAHRAVSVTYQPIQKPRDMEIVHAGAARGEGQAAPRPAAPPRVVSAQAVSPAPAPAASSTPAMIASSGQSSSGGDIGIGAIAPDFTLKDLNGNFVSLSQFRGRTVVLTFWGVRCVPCRHEAPFMSSLQQKYLDRGLVVLGVDAQDSTPAEVRRFAQAKSLRHTLLVYGWEMFKKRYMGQGLPRCYVLNHEGRVTARFDTYLPGDDNDIDAAVQRALGAESARPVAFNVGGGS